MAATCNAVSRANAGLSVRVLVEAAARAVSRAGSELSVEVSPPAAEPVPLRQEIEDELLAILLTR
jgi:hypothetical protein